jgi:hypothetical protein
MWAIESAGGLGRLLAQQLVAAGETVVDVPATLASRIRVLGTGRSDKNDPNDAMSVAIAALRAPSLREVAPADHAQVLRLLAKRNIDIGKHRTRVVCRLHNLLMELSPGGIAKELNASDAVALLERVRPATPVERARHGLAAELLADVQRLDEQLKDSHRRIRTAVAASQISLTELFGIGPIIACCLIGFTATSAGSSVATPTRPTTAPRRSSVPPVAGSCTESPSAATAASTTPCTSRRSARSASPTPRAAPTSSASSPRPRPRRTRSAR